MGEFADLPTAKKGAVGESIVDRYLKENGVIPYKPDVNCAHPFDRLCASRDKKNLYITEVKSKAARKYYPDTGINERHFETYRNISKKYGIEILIYFVDEEERKVYGGPLSRISKKHLVEHKGRILEYPIFQRGIVYFPLELMTDVADLTLDDALRLANLTTKSEAYMMEAGLEMVQT